MFRSVNDNSDGRKSLPGIKFEVMSYQGKGNKMQTILSSSIVF